VQRSTAKPQGLPSTSALSRHAIYQSFYLRSGAHAGAATPIAPPGRWPRITGRNGSSAFEIECVETPSVCACALWRVDNTQAPTLMYTLNEPQHTNTDSDLCRQEWDRRSAATPALARRLAQSNKDLRSRCCAARHASDRRSHPRTVPCSPLEGSAALYARRLRLSHDSSPLATSPREMWARAVLGTRVYSPTLTQARR
jgi:hypothetical protein